MRGNCQNFLFSWWRPSTITKYADKKQIRLASVWWWLRSCITKVPTVQFTQCHCLPAALFRSFSTWMVAYCISAVSTPIDTQMERSWAKFFILLLSFLSFYPIIFLLYWILAPVFVLIIHHICHFFYISHKQDFLIPNFNTKELQNLNRQWVCHSFRFWR